MGIDLTQPYSASNNGTASINAQILAEQYGFAYGFLNSVPELKNLFTQAVAQAWSPTLFTAKLQDTGWWQHNSQAAREAQTLKVIDPQTYSQNLQQAQADVLQQAASMGAAISTQTAQSIASMQVSNGWNTNQIAQALSKYVVEANRGGFGGLAGQNQVNLSQYALERGVTVDGQTMKNFLQAIAGNKMSVEDFQAFIRTQAASKYPAFAKEIAAGTPLTTLAAPYQQMAQQTLELGPNDTQIDDPLVQHGLNAMTEPNQAEPANMNLSDYQKFLQSQPQWKQTANAQAVTMQAASQVLKDMGLTA